MPKHIVDLLTNIGIPAADAVTIDSLPEAEQATFDAKPYLEKVKTNYQTQLQNDPAFFSGITIDSLPQEVKKKLEGTQFARAANITRDKLVKALGMTEADYADLTEDQKKELDHFIPAIAEKWTKTKSGDKETQAQLIEARKRLEEFNGMEEKIRGKYENESNQKINSTILRANVVGELSAIEGLKIPAADLAKTAEDILLGKYGYERVGDFSIELRQKANSAMKVLKDNSSSELTLKEALQQIAVDRNWITDEKKDDKGSGKVTIAPGKSGTLQMVAPHVQEKISKKIAAEA